MGPPDEPRVYNRRDLHDALRRFENELHESALKPLAISSYVAYATRFLRWLEGDYQPRNAGTIRDPTQDPPWTMEQLRRERDRYRDVLRDARLRPNAIQTYVHAVDVFLRWMTGEYRPRGSSRPQAAAATRRHKGVAIQQSLVRPEDLAIELGVPGIRIRNYLRARYPRASNERGQPWILTESQVAEVMGAFRQDWSRSPRRSAAAPTIPDDAPTDWFWEGHVQDAVVRYLVSCGWHIDQTSNTVLRAQGYDIAASRGERRLLVEVKGYPSVGYRDPRRAGEIKRSQPTLQAKHWFADALLKALRIKGTTAAEVAMAFPAFSRYLALIEDTRAPLETLGIAVLMVAHDGSVAEPIPLGLSRLRP